MTHSQWEAVKPGLRAKIPEPFFRTFIQPLEVARSDTPADRELSLIVPDEKLLEHIRLRYIKIIESSLRDADFRGRVQLLPQKSKMAGTPISRAESSPAPALREATAASVTAAAEAPAAEVLPKPSCDANALMATTTDDADHANHANQIGLPEDGYITPVDAGATIEQLRELRVPGPLVLLTGATGYGKTTLLRDLARRPGARYMSLETFLTEFSLACREKTVLGWRAEIRRLRLLVIDDFQFVKKGAGHSQEELRNLIDEFESHGCKLVLASDRPFDRLPLAEALRSRFFSGFRVDLPPPDFATRLAILKNETDLLGLAPASEDLVYLARHIAGDARKLKSAAQRLNYAIAGATGGTAPGQDPDRLAELCRDLFSAPLEIRPDQVLQTVCAHFRTTPEAVSGPSREKKTALARHLVATLCTDLAGMKFNQVAQLIGRRDHSCVVHARKKIAGLLESDLFFRQEVEGLKSEILRQARHAD